MTLALLDLAAPLAGCALVLGVPGPTNALLATAGAEEGRDGIVSVGAVVAGYAVSVTALRLVGGPVLEAIPEFGPALRLILAAWLARLGCCLWSRPTVDRTGGVGPRDVFVATLLNPKAAVFAFALWPPTTTMGDGATLIAWCVALALVVAAVSALWFAFGRLLATAAPRGACLVARLSALMLFGFAVTLGATAVTSLV